MNDVDELKRYALLHARGQSIPRYQRIVDRIHTDREGPGSWVREWSSAAESLARRDRHLQAARHYAMARFPYVDGPARQEAQDRCVAAFDRWRRRRRDIERLEVDLPGGRIRCWATGLATGSPRPLLLLMGGIVSVKEQNAAALANIARLGMAGVVAELPGVGENPLPYDDDSWTMLSDLLDALSDRADVKNTYAIAMSFSGHLAIRCAIEDPRLRGIVTVGAPVSEFFTDADWQERLPRVTVDTLAHLLRTSPAEVGDRLRSRALRGEQLEALDIPVYYTASRRDEIVPPGELRQLRDHVRHFHLLEHDDVHGSPRHIAETRMWSMAALLRIRDVWTPQRAVIELLWRAHRLRGSRG